MVEIKEIISFSSMFLCLNQKNYHMQETVLITMTKDDFKSIIMDAVTSVLVYSKNKGGISDEIGGPEEVERWTNGIIKKSQVYKKSHKGEIPCFRQGRKLVFRKSEIIQWMTENKAKTVSEIESEAAIRLVLQ